MSTTTARSYVPEVTPYTPVTAIPFVLKERETYLKNRDPENRYHIINSENGYILGTRNDIADIKTLWYNIPRRKTVNLFLIDNDTGEILKIKLRANYGD